MENKLTNFEAFSLCVNSGLGAGFLAIPWVFLQVGFIPALLILALFSFVSTVSSLHLVEAMSYTEALMTKKETPESQHPREMELAPTITNRQLTVTDMVEVILGPTWKMIFTISLFCAVETTLTAFASVFAASLTSDISIFGNDVCDIYEESNTDCKWKYLVYILIFAQIVFILTVIGIEEMKSLQTIATFMRISITGLMFLTAFYSIIAKKPLRPYQDVEGELEFEWDELGTAMAGIAFAGSYSMMVPTLTAMLANKEDALKIQVKVNVAISTIFLFMGTMIGAALISTNAPSQSTLAWVGYDAGIHPRPFWTVVVEQMIVLFPAVSVLSSAPLLVCGLQKNIINSFGKLTETEEDIIMLVVIGCPVLLAAITHELGFIGELSGLPTFFAQFAIGSILYLASVRKVSLKSRFSGWHSSDICAWINIAVCAIGCVATIESLIK